MYLLINPIDNTQTGKITDGINVKGYSHLTKLTAFNCGQIKDTKEICYFYNSECLQLEEDLFVIPESSIFLLNDELKKSGVIVEKHFAKQTANGFSYRQQQWFRVVMSNITVPEGALIIAKSRTSERFNYNKRELFFVRANNILFYLDKKVSPGPDKLFLSADNPKNPFEKPFKYIGIKNRKKYYFKKRLARLNLSGEQTYLVEKKDIFATLCSSRKHRQ